MGLDNNFIDVINDNTCISVKALSHWAFSVDLLTFTFCLVVEGNRFPLITHEPDVV